jgi:hypothetical protein
MHDALHVAAGSVIFCVRPSAVSMLISILIQALLECLAAQAFGGGHQQAAHTQALDLQQQVVEERSLRMERAWVGLLSSLLVLLE